jgi:intein-encoded DNA endonuclease-like protein
MSFSNAIANPRGETDMISLRKMPLEARVNFYEKAINLNKEGFRPHEIARMLSLSPRVVCLWLRDERTPGNEYLPKVKVNKERIDEIAYLAGVIHSDGSIGRYKNRCHIALKATDDDFILEFKRALKAVTEQCPPTRIEKARTHIYNGKIFKNTKPVLCVGIVSKELYEILTNPEEYINKSPEAYIRGFADGDGTIYESLKNEKGKVYRQLHIALYNKDLHKLEKIKRLLQQLSIQSSPIRKWAGNVYALGIHKKSEVEKYMQKIGFSIERKKAVYESLKRRELDTLNVRRVQT